MDAGEPGGGAAPDRSYPAGLLEWSGNRAGGVRRLFDDSSGRPGKGVFETNLLHRLRDWAGQVSRGADGVPRIILLVGGPGNGKTEAIESTIVELDGLLGSSGALLAEVSRGFHPPEGQPVPRLVRVAIDGRATGGGSFELDIVQDASVGGTTARPAALALVEELGDALAAGRSRAYLCCVNRGVLDDAMIAAIDGGLGETREVLETVARAVSQTADAPPCWPLDGFAAIAAWPMDAESLIEPTASGDLPPGEVILGRALDPARWPESCQAGQDCPFCSSRKLLSSWRERDALLSLLRWFELGTGKRWTFRDLFSVCSYVLAGPGAPQPGGPADPCTWAASRAALDRNALGRPKRDASAAIYDLVAAQYQHALFHGWDRTLAKSLLKDIRELGLHDTSNTAMGLYYFLLSRAGSQLPAMIAQPLAELSSLLDPATAPPDTQVAMWGGNATLGDLDARFSRSARDGLDFVTRGRVVSSLERTLLSRLADLDDLLSAPKLRRRRPTAANRLQRSLRDFACRLVRRSIGARQLAIPDAALFARFRLVLADASGKGGELHEIAIQVEDLLNAGANFEVSLVTTFGQPLPPARSRAVLEVPRRRVYARDANLSGRPAPVVPFLDVEAGSSAQPIAVTYDLFKAVSELEAGLSPASLPQGVLALLDTTKARMAGSIVRDRHVQERPIMHVGEELTVERHRGAFISTRRRRQ